MAKIRLLYQKMREKLGGGVKRCALPVLDIVFLALAGIYLLYLTEESTLFYLPLPAWFEQKLLIVMAVTAFCRLVLIGGYQKKVWIGLGLGVIYYMVYRSDGYMFLLYLAVLTIGFINIDYRKILKTYLLTVGAFFAVSVIGGLSGAIPNLVYLDGADRTVRSSWGICYPTDFASYIVFILIAIWICHKSMPDWLMLILAAGSAFIAWFIAHSETSLYCSILLAALVLYHGFYRHIVLGKRKAKWLDYCANGLMSIAFPVLAMGMFALIYLYMQNNGLSSRIDVLLSGRLKYTAQVYNQYGIQAFGSPFQQLGNGFTTLPQNTYQFVDSTYPLILIRYGWMMFASTLLLWCVMTGKAIKRRDKRMALALALIAVHAISEHHFPEVNYNILFVMPLAAYPEELNDEYLMKTERVKRLIPTLVLAGAAVIMGLLLPYAISVLRTVFAAMGWIGGREKGWPVIAGGFAMLVVILLLAVCVYRLIFDRVNRRRMKKLAAVGAAVSILAICVGFVGCNRIVDRAVRENQAMVDADAEAVSIVTQNARGRVYVDVLPEVYIRRFKGISRTVFTGEDLSRKKNITVIMADAKESQILIWKGFRYCTISDQHGVYTNDQAVIDALQGAGYDIAKYFNKAFVVNLAEEAARNSLPYEQDKGIRVGENGQSLIYGPYVELYSGRYTARYELSLPENAPNRDYLLCTLRVSAQWGQNVRVEQAVHRSQFDQNGNTVVEVPFSVGNWQGVEFLAFAGENSQFYVKNITYRRTP